jgi:hypothetical protein
MFRVLILVSFLVVFTGRVTAEEPKSTSLYNGKDLTGWVNVNCAPNTFAAKGDEIVTTGRPTGFLRSTKQYENFVMEVEWMHVEKTKMANSGIFVWGDPIPAVGTPYTRGIEVQVLINYKPADGWATSHGDIFSIWGAKCKPDRPHPKGLERCLPSEDRVKGAGEWNHYKITANDGTIKLEVNGKEVSGVSGCSPRKGYLALESEGVECHFRNLKVQELPTTNPTKEQTADVDAGHVSLFNGVSLDGWKAADNGWTAGGALKSNGKGTLTRDVLAGELVFDWKLPSATSFAFTIGSDTHTVSLPTDSKPGSWNRFKVKVPAAGLLTLPKLNGLEIMNVFHSTK